MKHAASVLVVEDNDRDFEIIATTLLDAGFEHTVKQVGNGEECREHLRNDRQIPDLLILDLNLPGLDGRDLLTEIKADPRLQLLPVVVMTTSSNPRDAAFCYRFGVSSYHIKPLKLSEFRHVVRTIGEFWLRIAVLPNRIDLDAPE